MPPFCPCALRVDTPDPRRDEEAASPEPPPWRTSSGDVTGGGSSRGAEWAPTARPQQHLQRNIRGQLTQPRVTDKTIPFTLVYNVYILIGCLGHKWRKEPVQALSGRYRSRAFNLNYKINLQSAFTFMLSTVHYQFKSVYRGPWPAIIS